MPMTSSGALSLVRASISNLAAAISEAHCERLHAEVKGYVQALHDCDVIDSAQSEQLMSEADLALKSWASPHVHLLDGL